ncbi:MAG: DUF4339 domain-containing protein [Planctomycetota bacterium]|nr:DUF4339 domain-containing protein [Planctomycetota bacterium]
MTLEELAMFELLHVDVSEKTGPYSKERIRELIRQKVVLSFTPLRPCGTDDGWTPASTFFPMDFGDKLARDDNPNPPEISENENWYYADDGGEVFGPVTLARLKILCSEGGITMASLVFKSGWPQWRNVAEIPIVSGFLPV